MGLDAGRHGRRIGLGAGLFFLSIQNVVKSAVFVLNPSSLYEIRMCLHEYHPVWMAASRIHVCGLVSLSADGCGRFFAGCRWRCP